MATKVPAGTTAAWHPQLFQPSTSLLPLWTAGCHSPRQPRGWPDGYVDGLISGNPEARPAPAVGRRPPRRVQADHLWIQGPGVVFGVTASGRIIQTLVS